MVGRVVIFCDLEKGTEFRFVTNLPEDGEFGVSNEEIAEIYRLRWQIELLWKFLKMHLKLDRIITKNVNGIEIQIQGLRIQIKPESSRILSKKSLSMAAL